MVPGTLPRLLFCCCGYLLVGLAFLPGLEKEAAGCTIKGREIPAPPPPPRSRYPRREAASGVCPVATAASPIRVEAHERLFQGCQRFTAQLVSGMRWAWVQRSDVRLRERKRTPQVQPLMPGFPRPTSVLCICKRFSVRCEQGPFLSGTTSAMCDLFLLFWPQLGPARTKCLVEANGHHQALFPCLASSRRTFSSFVLDAIPLRHVP